MNLTQKLVFSFFVSTEIILLAGCAGRLSPPSCPDSTGLTCARVDQINTLIDRGQLGVTPIGETPSGQAAPFRHFSPSTSFTSFTSNTVASGEPLWTGEKVLSVWLAPYEDKAGNYHQASVIDTVVQPGHWIGEPVTEMTEVLG